MGWEAQCSRLRVCRSGQVGSVMVNFMCQRYWPKGCPGAGNTLFLECLWRFFPQILFIILFLKEIITCQVKQRRSTLASVGGRLPGILFWSLGVQLLPQVSLLLVLCFLTPYFNVPISFPGRQFEGLSLNYLMCFLGLPVCREQIVGLLGFCNPGNQSSQ